MREFLAIRRRKPDRAQKFLHAFGHFGGGVAKLQFAQRSAMMFFTRQRGLSEA